MPLSELSAARRDARDVARAVEVASHAHEIVNAKAAEILSDPSTSADKKESVAAALQAADDAIDANVLQVQGDLLQELSALPENSPRAAGEASEKVLTDTKALVEVTKNALSAFQADVVKTAHDSFKTEWGEDAYSAVYAEDGDGLI